MKLMYQINGCINPYWLREAEVILDYALLMLHGIPFNIVEPISLL